jgi:WD40 repeat protein
MTDPKHLRRVAEWKSEDIAFAIARVPATERLFVGSSDFGVHEFDVVAEPPQRVPFTGEGHRSYVTGVALAGERLVTGSYDGRLIWWSVAERKAVQSVPAHDKWIRRVLATPDGTRIVSIADDMQIKAWDAASGELIKSFTDHTVETPHHFPSMLYAATCSANGKWLATGDKTGHVAVWDLTTLEKVGQIEAPVMYTWDPTQRRHSIGGIRALAFSPDGTRLAVGGIGTIGNIDHLDGKSRVEVFDWQAGTRIFELEDDKRKGIVEQFAWLANGSVLLCAGGDHKGFLKLYDMNSGELLHQDGNDGHIHGFVVDEHEEHLYLACHNRVEKWTLLPPPTQDTPASMP